MHTAQSTHTRVGGKTLTWHNKTLGSFDSKTGHILSLFYCKMFNTMRLINIKVSDLAAPLSPLMSFPLCSPFTTVGHLLICNIVEKKLEQKATCSQD